MSKALYLYQCKSARRIQTYDDPEYDTLTRAVADASAQLAALRSQVASLESSVSVLHTKMVPLENLGKFILTCSTGITSMQGAGQMRITAANDAVTLSLGLSASNFPILPGTNAITLTADNIQLRTANGVYSNNPVRIYEDNP